MDDRRLTRLIGRLLERADFPGRGRIGSEELPDWPEGAHQALVDLRLLKRETNERGLVCDECEEACWLEPTRTTDAHGQDVLVQACLQGRDVGLLVFDPSRLVAWRLDLEGLAAGVGAALNLDDSVEEVEPGWAWEIGRAEIVGRTKRVYLASGLGGSPGEPRWSRLRRRLPPEDLLIFVPARVPAQVAGDDPAVVRLAGLIEIAEGGLQIAPDRLARALSRRGSVAAVSEGARAPATHRAAPGSRWNQVKVWLVNGDTVRVELPGRAPQGFTAAELGLVHQRSTARQQTKGWQILSALCNGNGTCSWRAGGCASFGAFKVQVSELGRRLGAVIGIGGSPFHSLPRNGDLRSHFQAGPLESPPPYVGEDLW